MSEHSRRHFLRTASLGAAAVGVAAAVPTMSSADAATPAVGPDHGAAHDGPFAVWVKDVGSGEIAVLVGESEVVHHDKALATALARIAARG